MTRSGGGGAKTRGQHVREYLRSRHGILHITGGLYLTIGAGFLTVVPPLRSIYPGVSQGWVWIVVAIIAIVSARNLVASSTSIGLLTLAIVERLFIAAARWHAGEAGWFSAVFYLPLLYLLVLAAVTPSGDAKTLGGTQK